MKKVMFFLSLVIVFFCKSQNRKNALPTVDSKFEKPPKPGKNKLIDKLPQKLSYYFNSAELKKNVDGLFCWNTSGKCHIIDGKTVLYSYYQTSGDDNPKLVPYNFAEGEFLEGKYQGIWKYYDENRKVIKKEKWDAGKLVYRKEYK